jgi:hypothetical protein
MEGSSERSEMLLDAALVEAVLGDLDSCEVWARRALAAGLATQYFELPWFDRIRPRLGHVLDDQAVASR